jgi:DNA-binding transcriptional MerR regulator
VVAFDQVQLSGIMDDKLTVAEIAQRAGIAPSHVRFYQRAGLLPAPARVGRHVLYPASVLERLQTIASAREAGLSLEEVGELSRLCALLHRDLGQGCPDERGDGADEAGGQKRRHDAEPPSQERDGRDAEQRDLPGLLQRAGQRDRRAEDRAERRRRRPVDERTRPRVGQQRVKTRGATDDEQEGR